METISASYDVSDVLNRNQWVLAGEDVCTTLTLNSRPGRSDDPLCSARRLEVEQNYLNTINRRLRAIWTSSHKTLSLIQNSSTTSHRKLGLH